MSVVLRANQLNILVYKYFLEAGLTHSAYTFFNEANLTEPLQEFRFDIKAGHLLSLLEKALIYAKIQAHVNFSEYTDCEEPFYLLKPHTCKVVQRVRKEREELMRNMEEQINDGIRRTNSIYNTAISNKQFEDIVYEPRGHKFFDRFPKIKLPVDGQTDLSIKIDVSGSEHHTLLYNPQDYEIDTLKFDTMTEEYTIESIYPCLSQGQLTRNITYSITNQHLIQLFSGNHVTIFPLGGELSPIELTLPLETQLSNIDSNPNLPHIICFKNNQEYCILNCNTFRLLSKGKGNFYWRAFDEYIIKKNGELLLMSITETEPKFRFEGGENCENVLFNNNKTIFVSVSYSDRAIHIYTFESQKPLFIFNSEETIQQVLVVTCDEVDYLCWLTAQKLKVFDISLNAYSKVITLNEYDPNISTLTFLKKADKEEMYLVALGEENLLVFDIKNSKTERVEIEGDNMQIKQLGKSRVSLTVDGNVYFLGGSPIDLLFK